MKNYFTADLHIGHHNIISYDGRPFNTIVEHDQTIVNNWNSIVKKEDNVYFLGDFSLGYKKAKDYDKSIMLSLNGNKFFIKGNHDHDQTVKSYKETGTYLGQLAEINIDGQIITLCHYAMLVWNKSHRGAWQLHGHSHHSLPIDNTSLRLDVGINGTNYFPLSFQEIREILKKREYKPIDDHQ